MTAGWNRTSDLPLLVAGQPLRSILRRRQAQEDRRVRQSASNPLRYVSFCRRLLEPGRDHFVLRRERLEEHLSGRAWDNADAGAG